MYQRNDTIAQNEIVVYKNNANIKGTGVNILYTKEQIEERIKCKNDIIYFIETYMRIVTLDDGLVPFKLYDFQKKLIRAYERQRFVIAKLPRQVGKSTVTIAYILWVVLFGPMQQIAILANKSSTSRDILAKLKLAYEYIPLWMQQGVIEWNKGNIELENGSRVMASSTSSTATRGGSYNLIFLDEFAFVPHTIADEFITSVYPTISSGKTTKVFMVSTPNGMNLFYKYWTDAVNKENLYFPIEAHYSVVPGRNKQWAEDQRKQLGAEKFNQEFLCSFLGSSKTLVSTSKLETLAWTKPIFSKDGLDIFDYPIKEHLYTIAVDVSEGQGLDYSAITIIDCTSVPYSVVGKYRSKTLSYTQLPAIIDNLTRKYNNAHVLIETNGIGLSVADSLHGDLENENIFSTTNMGRGGQKLSSGFKKNSKLGIKLTTQIKSIGCATLKSLLENDQLLIRDFHIISELTYFVVSGHSYAAENGRHDDLVSTLVMFGWLTTQPMFGDMTNNLIRQQIREQKDEDMYDEIISFGVHSDEINRQPNIVDPDGTMWEVVDDDRSIGNIEAFRRLSDWYNYK